MNIEIIIATHKKYRMPTDNMYLPVQVGAYNTDAIGYMRDDEGDNISFTNKNYCELTGLYWAWKNTEYDYLGLAHYRRHFVKRGIIKPITKTQKWERVVDKKYLTQTLLAEENETKIILPCKRYYFIESNYSQYIHAHHAEDLDITRKIIVEKFPDYVESYDKVMGDTKGHRFNMFIMERTLADKYCEWLFDILFELEKRLNISEYTDNDKRVFGFVSERLLDVWIKKNKCKYEELPVAFMEKQNWVKKIIAFLRRKFK